jgi:hypothetical protein
MSTTERLALEEQIRSLRFRVTMLNAHADSLHRDGRDQEARANEVRADGLAREGYRLINQFRTQEAGR